MIIYVDIDDTICKSEEKINLENKYSSSFPIHKNIDIINKLYDNGHTIIYWTARGTLSNKNYFDLTYKQLITWGVKFHELRMGKPAFDLLIDDKTLNITENIDINDIINKNTT
jgi:hypothetical protein